MDFTNINDPAGVKALLDQLRTSQAWQELNTATNTPQSGGDSSSRGLRATPNPLVPLASEPNTEPEPSPLVSNHISSLLSRLQPGAGAPPPPLPLTHSSECVSPELRQGSAFPSASLKTHESRINPSTPIRHSPAQTKPPQTLKFNQALPVIARLADNPAFLKKLEKMRQDQAYLEQNLWEQRTQILKNQEEKVKVAQAKAIIIGSGLSRSDASALESSFQKELKTFDSEQALPAWDALVTKQQSTLEAFEVPAMFVTASKADRQKQQRIIQVLDGISGPEDEDMAP